MRVVTLFCLLLWMGLAGNCQSQAVQHDMQIEIDARDLPRKLLHSQLQIPLTPSSTEQTVALWYPKWVPGSHGPGGPVQNVAGLRIEDQDGKTLSWQRTPGEVFRIEVKTPASTSLLRVSLRYITNQPSTGSFGHDSWGSSKIGVISPNTILLYPETADVNAIKVATTLILPHQWQAATALPSDPSVQIDSGRRYQAVSLSRLVDSPIMCGAHLKTFDLVESERAKVIPPHRLHLFADDPSQCELNPEILAKFQAMVTQAALLMGSHPFDQFDILLGATRLLPANGLEHSKSTFNILPPSALGSPRDLRGWNRLLIPHEYMHAWCGKYRRPAGMVSSSFHTPENTELLWVYEGLTQYLGELVEARCGLMDKQQFTNRLLVELRRATYQQGRQWRTLADTGAAAHILRDGSDSWPALRRSQDFYMEGMLFWLEADAILRQKSGGTKSLEDFCRQFFLATANSTHPNPYTRADLVNILNSLVSHDWDGLIGRRVESFQTGFDPAVAELLGYRFVMRSEPLSIAADTFRHVSGIDAYDSIGAVFSNDGVVKDMLLGSPADRARLMPEMKIIGVGKYVWSSKRLLQAIEESASGTPIDLKVVDGDEVKTIQIHYFDGTRWLHLVRDDKASDLLGQILAPLR